mgnify:CR=1 FL=1
MADNADLDNASLPAYAPLEEEAATAQVLTWGTVKLLENEAAFRASFHRFSGDRVNGHSAAKDARRGQNAEVEALFGDQTATIRFEDGDKFDVPFEALIQVSVGANLEFKADFEGMINRLENKEDIDSFDMQALEPGLHGCELAGNRLRACLCFFLQAIAPPGLILVMLHSYLRNSYNDSPWWTPACPALEGWENYLDKIACKLLAAGLVLYMYNFITTQEFKYTAKPTYMVAHGRIFAFVPAPWWMGLGLFSNGMAMVWGAVGSVILIGIAETPIDIVLNSVALFFLLDIDDQLVDKYDYDRNLETFKWEIKKPETKPYDAWVQRLKMVAFFIDMSLHLTHYFAPVWMLICK